MGTKSVTLGTYLLENCPSGKHPSGKLTFLETSYWETSFWEKSSGKLPQGNILESWFTGACTNPEDPRAGPVQPLYVRSGLHFQHWCKLKRSFPLFSLFSPIIFLRTPFFKHTCFQISIFMNVFKNFSYLYFAICYEKRTGILACWTLSSTDTAFTIYCLIIHAACSTFCFYRRRVLNHA